MKYESKIEVKDGQIQVKKQNTWKPKVKDPRVGHFNGPRLVIETKKEVKP